MNLLLLLLWMSLWANQSNAQQTLSLLFYNVENLMDVENDPLTRDDEFTPKGNRAWTNYKLQRKIDHLAKVIMAANGYDYPDIIGLCEVENRQVIERLLRSSSLCKLNYKYIHKDSPDSRGIDVALLYRSDKIRPLKYDYHPLVSPSSDTLATREILEYQFATASDSFQVFVNHWPSRYGGETQSAPKRMLTAETLWQIISENQSDPNRNCHTIIMGDFNDEPADASMQWLSQEKHQLLNLSAHWDKQQGTLKYQSQWNTFDQILISTSLQTMLLDAQVVRLPFLLQPDEKWGGEKLFRTYYGFQYEGGFADHLPVMLRLKIEKDF